MTDALAEDGDTFNPSARTMLEQAAAQVEALERLVLGKRPDA